MTESTLDRQKEGEPVRVFLRLRPMNKFETSKRSKDCIELHDNPQIITVDSPLLGTYDFTFDQVFDEYAPQEEVYKACVADVAEKLLSGIHCSVIAYGQTGTGKTHTMLGEGLGVELTVRARGEASSSTPPMDDEKLDPKKHPEWTGGMIPRAVEDIFDLMMQESPETVDFVVRCSFVEIYLEKICDLLQPWREEIRIGDGGVPGDAVVVGASEVCCLNPADVYALLAKGNAYRTKAATDRNMDSSRSHAVFTLRLEKMDRLTGKTISSRLQMFDLAGSEIGKSKSTRDAASPTAMESRMINASLASFQNIVRATLAQQGKDSRFHPRSLSNPSNIAKLLKPCFGARWNATMICTGSPSSYSIQDTMQTIKFGQQVREVINKPLPPEPITPNVCRSRLDIVEKRQEGLMRLAKMLAHECKHVKGRSKGKDSGNTLLWGVIEKIVEGTSRDEEVEVINVSIHRKGDPEVDETNSDKQRIDELEKKLEEERLAREKAETQLRGIKSDTTALRSQAERLTKEKCQVEAELELTKDELKATAARKTEIEHYLRTSQFREHEAVLFLRQFRTFYFRLLKSKASHGNGSTRGLTEDVSKRIPGVSDLKDLIDVDMLLIKNGLIESSEAGKDTNSPEYGPSDDAMTRSRVEAVVAETKEFDLLRKSEASDDGIASAPISISNGKGLTSYSLGQLTSYRLRLLETPAGRLAMQKEQELEHDLNELAKKVVSLQNSLVAEKTMVEALSARQGAMSKMKAAQELNLLKQELERKTNDLHAIVWKMNELHLVNKTINTKTESRENHVNYLEEHLVDLQTANRRLALERLVAEKRLKDENTKLADQVDGMNTSIWQISANKNDFPPWRLALPCTGEQLDILDPPGRDYRSQSLGEVEDFELQDLGHLAPTIVPREKDKDKKREK